MLPASLRRYGGDCSLEDFQQGLLNALPRHISSDGRIFRFSRDFIDFININNSGFSPLGIVVCGLEELQEYVLDILAHIASLSQGSSVGDREGNVQALCKRLCQVGLSATGWANHENVGLGNFYIIVLFTSGR